MAKYRKVPTEVKKIKAIARKQRTASDLLDSIVTDNVIACTKCDDDESVGGDEFDAADYFFSNGWRATQENTYCPKCTKKYLKPEKK